MSALYREVVVGATAYGTTGPMLSTIGAGASGTTWWQGNYLQGWEPTFHKFRALGASGSDVFVSWDGVNDHARIPAAGAAGVLSPLDFAVSYKNVWLRSAAGVSGSVGVGLYSR